MYRAMLTWYPKVSELNRTGLIIRVTKSYTDVPEDMRKYNTIVVDLPGRMLVMRPEEALKKFGDRDLLILGDRERIIKHGKVIKKGKDVPLEVHVPYEDPEELMGIEVPTKEDLKMIELAKRIDAHAVLISMVMGPEDVERYSEYLPERVVKIAKIESVSALRNFERIAEAADGVIIARGDLYLNAGPEGLLEAYEKIHKIIEEKLVYIGSGFLESLSRSPRPDRAEIMDLYYALSLNIDGVLFTKVSKVAPELVLERFEKISSRFMRTQCRSTFLSAGPSNRIIRDLVKFVHQTGCSVEVIEDNPRLRGAMRLVRGVDV